MTADPRRHPVPALAGGASQEFVGADGASGDIDGAATRGLRRQVGYLYRTGVRAVFWVASLFSMSEDFGPGQKQFRMYFATALPVVLVLFVFMQLDRLSGLAKRVKGLRECGEPKRETSAWPMSPVLNSGRGLKG